MKKVILSIAVIAMSAFLSNNVMAQSALETPVGAKIVTPLIMTQTAAMHFGTMTIPTAESTVLLGTDNVATSASGDVVCLAQAPIAASAAYDIVGAPDSFYQINLPADGTVEIKLPGDLLGDNNMAVSDFTHSYGVEKGTLSELGAGSFSVGATLNLAANQPAGTYTGTFNVSVVYN